MAIGVFVVTSIPAGNWQKRTVLHISAIFLMFVQAEQNRTPTNCPQCVFSGLKFHCMTSMILRKVWVGHFMSYPKRRRFMMKYMDKKYK